MKAKTQVRLLLMVGAIGSLLSIGLYWSKFWCNGLSSDPGDWANFGSYIGGVLGPFAAMLALWGAAISIGEQRKAQREQNGHNLLSIMQKYEADLDSMLRAEELRVVVNGQNIDTNLFDLLTNITYWNVCNSIVLPPDTANLRKIGEKTIAIDDYRIQHILSFSKATGHLKVLSGLIQDHKNLTRTNVIADYYHTKYDVMVRVLIRGGYNLKPWDSIKSMSELC